jgi:hypothetical protein
VSRRLLVGLAGLLSSLLWLACPADDDDTSPGDDDDETSADDDDGEIDLRIDLVEARTQDGGEAYPYASAGSPIPWDLWWVPTVQEGACTYFDVYLPLCDPPCVPPEICVDDGVCEELPDAPYVGTIEVDGLSVPLTLTAEAPYYYYLFEFGDEPPGGDLFGEGDPITASADGGDGAPFTVGATGGADLQADLACPPPLEDGQPLTVTWTPGGQGDPVRFTLRSGNHGNQFSSIVCETGDSGELVVGAELLDAYRAGFHPVDVWILERAGSGQTVADGVRVELRAIAQSSCTY